MSTEVKIGGQFWIFDENRRVYPKDERGHSYGRPIFRGHFCPVIVTGETRMSWVINYFDRKVPKRDPWSVLYTDEMVDDAVWQNAHVSHIRNMIWRAKPAQLRQIAAILGYEPKD